MTRLGDDRPPYAIAMSGFGMSSDRAAQPQRRLPPSPAQAGRAEAARAACSTRRPTTAAGPASVTARRRVTPPAWPCPATPVERGAPMPGCRAAPDRTIARMQSHAVDSRYAWTRLVVTLLLMTIGSSGMYVVAVVLPAVQAEFGVARADASLPYTLLMIGFGVGGVLMGRLADRFGVDGAAADRRRAASAPASSLAGTGAAASGRSRSRTACCIGLLGSSATFAPLVADTSLWFERRRGIAVAICASGNYLGGAIWPPIVQHFVESVGWRQTYVGLGIFCVVDDAAARAAACARRPPVAGGRAGGRRAGTRAPSTRAVRPARRRRRRRCCASPASPAAWRCRCRRCTSSPTAATSATARRAAREMLSLMLGLRHRQPARLGRDLRPHRRPAHAAARLGAAGRGAAAVPAVRRRSSRST